MMVAALVMILSSVWILGDFVFSIWRFLEIDPAVEGRAPAGTRVEVERGGPSVTRDVELRNFALDFSWLAVLGVVFWIGGALTLQ